MSQNGCKQFGILEGGQYARRDPRSFVVRQAALDARAKLAALMLGKRKSRALGCVQAGITTPLTRPLEFMSELKDARIGYDESFAIAIVPQIKALARLHGREWDTGEFTPPTTPTRKSA